MSDDNDMSTHVVNRRSGQHGRKNLVSFTDLVAQGVPRFTESLDCGGACRDRRSFGNRRLVELGLGLVVGFRLGKPDQLFRLDRSSNRWFNHRSFNYWSFGNRSFNTGASATGGSTISTVGVSTTGTAATGGSTTGASTTGGAAAGAGAAGSGRASGSALR